MAGSYMIAPQLNVLSLLHDQYRLYTIDLGRVHEGLNKQYKKLHKSQKKLDELEKQEATRAERRKLIWSRTSARQTIADLSQQQSALYDLLQQCRDLIASYNMTSQPLTPWTTYWPANPYAGAPFTPWTANTFSAPTPQYWDLSMLGEQSEASDVSELVFHGQDFSIFPDEAIVGDQLQEQDATDPLSMGLVPVPLSRTTRAASAITVDTERANQAHRRRFSENITKSAPIRPALKNASVSDEEVKARLVAQRAKTAPELHVHTEATDEDSTSRDQY